MSGSYICRHITWASQVVNAETNAGIVFENDYGGAHILYRPQLEELLGNGQQLEGLSFVFINGCSSVSWRPVSLRLKLRKELRHCL